MAGRLAPPPRGPGHPAALRHGRIRVLGSGAAPGASGPRRLRVRACPDVVITVGALPSLRGAVREVVLAPTVTSLAVFPGSIIQPLGQGPPLAFPAGAALPGLLEALGAFFPMEDAPPQDQPEALNEPG